MAYVHDGLLHVNQVIFRLVMFESGQGIAVAFHERLTLHVIFPQAVDHDMHIDIAAFVMAVCVGLDKGLVSGEILFGKFPAKSLRSFPGQAIFRCVFRIEAEDVVVGFDFIIILVFVVFCIQFFTFHVKRKGIAVYAGQVIFRTGDQSSSFVQNGFIRVFLMLKRQILLYLDVVAIFTCDVFQYRHVVLLWIKKFPPFSG